MRRHRTGDRGHEVEPTLGALSVALSAFPITTTAAANEEAAGGRGQKRITRGQGSKHSNFSFVINVESSAGKESISYNRPNIYYFGGEPWTNHDISGGWDLVTKL